MKKDMEKNSINCINCDMGCNPSLQEKGLCPLTSTSILCNKELLKHNRHLSLVRSNGENEYYLVEGTNTVIMHVEEDFCILVDYMEITDEEYRKPGGEIFYYPVELCKHKYNMQRINGRDYAVRGEDRRISYDIIELYFGMDLNDLEDCGLTSGYERETYDERIYCIVEEMLNAIDKSHHVRVKITSMDVLNLFIDDIIEAKNDGVYYDVSKQCRDKRGRDFVEWCNYE